MRKAQRHLLIKQVIEEFPIRTQEELLNKLGDGLRTKIEENGSNDFSRYT